MSFAAMILPDDGELIFDSAPANIVLGPQTPLLSRASQDPRCVTPKGTGRKYSLAPNGGYRFSFPPPPKRFPPPAGPPLSTGPKPSLPPGPPCPPKLQPEPASLVRQKLLKK